MAVLQSFGRTYKLTMGLIEIEQLHRRVPAYVVSLNRVRDITSYVVVMVCFDRWRPCNYRG